MALTGGSIRESGWTDSDIGFLFLKLMHHWFQSILNDSKGISAHPLPPPKIVSLIQLSNCRLETNGNSHADARGRIIAHEEEEEKKKKAARPRHWCVACPTQNFERLAGEVVSTAVCCSGNARTLRRGFCSEETNDSELTRPGCGTSVEGVSANRLRNELARRSHSLHHLANQLRNSFRRSFDEGSTN